MQDIPSPNAAKHGNARARTMSITPMQSSERRDRLRLLLLGTNLWVVCVVWPALAGQAERGIDLASETLGLLPLALGAWLGRGEAGSRRDVLRPLLLLVVFPAALCGAVALRPEPLNQELFGPLALCLLAISLCAYGAAVTTALARNAAPQLHIKSTALGADPWDAPPPESERPRRAFIAACVAGAAALAWVAPSLGGYAELQEGWGDAAAVGGVLTAVVGCALAVALLAIFLGEGLRAPVSPTTQSDPGLRTAWFLFLALLGAVTYFVVQP